MSVARAGRLDIFASAVRDDFDPVTSDLDCLVAFHDLSPAQHAEAYFVLKESLEGLLGKPADLITEANLENPYFRDRIESERQPLYAS